MKIPRFKRTVPKQKGKIMIPSTWRRTAYNAIRRWIGKHWKTVIYLNLAFWLAAVPTFWLMYVFFWIGRLTAKWSFSRKKKAIAIEVAEVKVEN